MLVAQEVKLPSLGYEPGFPSVSKYPCNPWTFDGLAPGACPSIGSRALEGLGFSIADFSLGAATWAGVAALALIAFAFLGGPARERRTKLKEEGERHRKALGEIKSKYGRLGRRG